MTTEAETLEAPVAGPGVAPRDHNLPSGEELLLMVAREPTLPLTDRDMRARFIAALEADVADAGDDVGTEAARSKISDASRRVSRYKTGIDKARLGLTADLRAKVTFINDEGKAVDTTLQALQDRVSAPLTAWKAAEAQRQEAVKRVFDRIAYCAIATRDTESAFINASITELEAMAFDRAIFTEGTMAVEEARDNALRDLRVTKAASEQREAEARELDTLREKARLQEEKDRKEAYARSIIQHIIDCGNGFIGGQPQPYGLLLHELQHKIVIDESFGELEAQARSLLESTLAKVQAAFDEARRKSDEQAEQARIAQADLDAIDNARREKEASDQRAAALVAQAEQAAQARIDDANRQLETERQERIAEQARLQAIADADAARARDQAHRAEVHAKAEEAIVALGITAAKAKQVVMAIAAGNVPGVSVEY